MLYSMTGYGRAMQTLHGREITVELRAVNNRYLDCSVKLPRVFSFAEDAVKQQIKESVSRGKVDVLINIAVQESQDVRISLNRPVLEGYLAAMREISERYAVQDDISVSTLTRFPDIFVIDKTQEDEEQVKADILAVSAQAIANFNAMRAREGEALARDLSTRSEMILRLVELVEARNPETVQAYHARLEAKLRELLESRVDESRIVTEAAIFADKVAVDEETVRLRSHISQLRRMLEDGGAIGRKLDFLMQEMNREANTIGSKVSDLELTRTVVEIKAELEKMREQMQNIA